MKKNLFKILLALACFSPVLAQAVVLAPKDATVPKTQPLQPIPEFVAPNYEHSVDSPSGNEAVGSPEASADIRPTAVEETAAMAGQEKGNWIFILTASLVGIIFVLVVFTLKKSRSGDHQ